ncbi:MAG: hypothetical protein Q8R37_02790 [Nanoarchaeota archaeon]|nr:hypothetical protein [Nanoarchaeota archaeon]
MEIPWLFWLIVFTFCVPQVFLILFTIISYKQWHKHKTSVWKAAFISSFFSMSILLLITLISLIFIALEPYSIYLLLLILSIIPYFLGLLVLGWALLIVFFTVKARIKKEVTDIKQWQLMLAIILMILILIIALGRIIHLDSLYLE